MPARCYTSHRRPAMNCVNCQKSDEEATLQKCPICFKWVCEDCGRKRSTAGSSAAKRCADQFFFGDDDE